MKRERANWEGAATTIIKNIRLLKGAAVLAERKAVTPSLDLKRLNLFYGFNGSGKSTLSRIFAALQHGKRQDRLPEGCTSEIEMSDGAKFTYPKALTGLEKRVCVFNTDFIAENFRWETGVANPVFYIGAGQAEAADQLKALEATLPAAQTRHEGEAKVLNVREKAFNDYKRVLARTVSERLRQAARYEAPQFVADVDKLGASVGDKLSDADLDAATATCARSEPPAKVKLVEVPVSTLLEMIEAAVELAPKSIGSIVVGGSKTIRKWSLGSSKATSIMSATTCRRACIAAKRSLTSVRNCSERLLTTTSPSSSPNSTLPHITQVTVWKRWLSQRLPYRPPPNYQLNFSRRL
jgi:energy-coupling factor transporter ATP-binding protein EcfA2